MTADMPDPVKVAREAAQEVMGAPDFGRQYAARGPAYLATTVAEAAARAMQDAMAGQVRVKALEWMDYAPFLQAETSDRQYLLRPSGLEKWSAHTRLRFSGSRWSFIGIYENLPDAKAAASSHHSAVIGPSLEPAGAQEGADESAYRHVKECLHRAEDRAQSAEDALEKVEDLLAEFGPDAPAIIGEYLGERSHALALRERGTAKDVRTEPTPAPDVPGLMERAKATATSAAEDGDFKQVTRTIVLLRDLAAALEALQAEVAAKDARIMGLERDRRNQALDALALADRATAAEAERDALKAEVEALRAYIADAPPADVAGLQAEVERKDKALRDAIDALEAFNEFDAYLNPIRAALSPAKAGG